MTTEGRTPDEVAEEKLQLAATRAALREHARIAGLKDFETPTLEQVERRRLELLLVAFVLLIGLAVGVAFLSTAVLDIPLLDELGAGATVIRVLLVVLAGSFGFYMWEKERHLAKLSRALVNERVLSAALSNRLKEISLLTEAGKAVVSHLELEEVLKVILNAASELLEADEGSVMLVEGDELAVAAASGHALEYVGSRMPSTQGLSGFVAREREPLLIEGRPDIEGLGEDLPPRDRDIASAISVPLVAKGELLGILNLNVTEGERRFNEYDLRALTLFGEHAAMAIRHARALRREREMRLKIAELDRIRSELVGSMTHDLKTPLTTILGSAKMLLSRYDQVESEKRHDLLESIERQSQRLLGLIERLLDASRSQSHYPMSVGPIDVVAQVEPLARAYASAHDRRIVVEKEAERLEAHADPDAVEQVVANLLENAVKHTPDGTTIRLRLEDRGRQVAVTVADDGPGIPADELATLFEPFRRGRTEDSTGVGLGLFIVSNLIEGMGGEVKAASPPEGGAAFTFTLPKDGPVSVTGEVIGTATPEADG